MHDKAQELHMRMKKNRRRVVLAFANLPLSLAAWPAMAQASRHSGFPGGLREALGPNFDRSAQVEAPPRRQEPPPPVADTSASRLRYWNEIALDANALDHTPAVPGEVRVFGEQFGPTRTSRAFAIVHIAMFDAVNAIARNYQGYSKLSPPSSDTSFGAAVAQSAHDTLAALYPSQRARFDKFLTDDLCRIPDGRAKVNGIDLGRRAASAILDRRANDGSDFVEPRVGVDFFPSNAPGKWRPDPISQIPLALGAYWGRVTPFVLTSAERFEPPPPPGLTSPEYAAAFNEVKNFGGDGVITPTKRTSDQTVAGIYWSYDGTPGIGTPPRLYNQIAVQIAKEKGTNLVELARLLALLNLAMADGAIAGWKTKYDYQFWRPVTGIREADAGTGPTGAGDRNPATSGVPNFTPLGAQASNLIGPNFTPPFPSYISGHAVFGSAMFQTLRDFYGTDDIAFTFVSDEFNGVTRDNHGRVRPLIPRRFSSLSQAQEENGQSRIYLGIHWQFDKNQGIAQGRGVADYVFKNALLPLH
jgi:hypothetical protein